MKTLSQYKEDINALMKKVGDIRAKATSESRNLASTELALTNELLSKVEELKEIVVTMEREERISAALESPGSPVTVQRSHITAPKDTRSQDKFNSLGEQLSAVMNAGRPGGNVDPRLFNAASGLNETVPSDGGLI